MEIEVFRIGTFIDSNGNEKTYTKEDLMKIANNYNSKLAIDNSAIAPIVKGHPQDNSPAYGWVAYLKVIADKLIAGIRDISPEFSEELNQGKFKKVSISLYPDLLLRHKGFLGAASPAVNGLEPAEFVDYYDNLANKLEIKENDYKIQNDYSEEYRKMKEQISCYQKDIEKYQKAERLLNYKNYCSKITHISSNNALNQIIDECLPELMNIAFEYDSQNNSENYNLSLIKNFAEKIVKLPILSNINNSQNKTISQQLLPKQNISTISKIDSNFSHFDNEKLIKHNNTIDLMISRPELSYEEALELIDK